MNREAFESQLRGLVSKGTGIESSKVIPGNDAGAAPAGLYASVLLILDDTLNLPIVVNRKEGESEVNLDTRISRRASYSVQCYRKGAYDAMKSLVNYLWSDVAALEADYLAIKVYQTSEIRQLDEIINDLYEERCGIDLIVDYWDDKQYRVNAIETAEVINRN